MRKLLISTGFAVLALAVGGCEENVQIASLSGTQAPMAAPGEMLGESGELKGEVKVVYVNGQPDYCVVVYPGTDIPVTLASN